MSKDIVLNESKTSKINKKIKNRISDDVVPEDYKYSRYTIHHLSNDCSDDPYDLLFIFGSDRNRELIHRLIHFMSDEELITIQDLFNAINNSQLSTYIYDEYGYIVAKQISLDEAIKIQYEFDRTNRIYI